MKSAAFHRLLATADSIARLRAASPLLTWGERVALAGVGIAVSLGLAAVTVAGAAVALGRRVAVPEVAP
jgi:hypothetical protein